jgi:hypothetical protein
VSGVSADRYGGTIGRIRNQREKIRAKDKLDLRVPDYEDLQIRYRLMSEKATEDVARKIEAAQKSGSSKKNMGAVADFLIAACESILVRVGDGFEPLVDDEGQAIRFDASLAEVLGITGAGEELRAQEIVLETFSPEGDDGLRRNPDAMLDHFMAIAAWRKGREHEIDRELLGE